jgi:hypothetical protein
VLERAYRGECDGRGVEAVCRVCGVAEVLGVGVFVCSGVVIMLSGSALAST